MLIIRILLREMKKIIEILIICILFFMTIMNFLLLTIGEHEPEFYYLSNPIIKFIYILSILFNLSILFFVMRDIVQLNFLQLQSRFIVLIILICLSILLILSEIIFSSFQYYGGINAHQNLLIGSNNLGFWGISFLSICLIFFSIERIKSRNNLFYKVFFFSLLLFVSIFFFYYLL